MSAEFLLSTEFGSVAEFAIALNEVPENSRVSPSAFAGDEISRPITISATGEMNLYCAKGDILLSNRMKHRSINGVALGHLRIKKLQRFEISD